MKSFFIILFLVFFCCILKAQTGDFEIKVVSKKYQNVKGVLQKVSPEGIGIEDYKGNYLIFRTEDLVRIKVRKRGLTIGEGAAAGTLGGLGLGGAILSLDEDGESSDELVKLTAALTVSGAFIGTVTGVIAEIANTKFALTIDGNAEKFKKHYQKLEKYINPVKTYHINSRL